MNRMALSGAHSKQIVATILLLVAGWLAAWDAALPDIAAAEDQRPMPAFELEALDGSRFSSKELAGKVVLVDLWATWCKPCLAEIPHWNELHERYGKRGFTVLGITIQSGWVTDIKSDIDKFDFEIKYPLVVGNEEVEEAFGGVVGFPTSFLITRDGEIYKKYTGLYPEKQKEIEAAIKKLLSKNP